MRVLDVYHIVELGTAAVVEVRHRVQQDTLGRRGRKGDPLHGFPTILRAGAENLIDKQQTGVIATIELHAASPRGRPACAFWEDAAKG